MKIKLKLAPEVAQRMKIQPKSNATEPIQFYTNPAFAAKIALLAKATKRSVSSLVSEMVEYAYAQLEDGVADLEETPSAMHPVPANSPLSWASVPNKRNKKQRELSLSADSDEAVEQTLSRIGGDVWPDSTVAARKAYKNNLRGKGHYVPDDDEE